MAAQSRVRRLLTTCGYAILIAVILATVSSHAEDPQFPLFDLVGPVDVNGWWLNPQWVTQTRTPATLPSPYDCPGLEPWNHTCTTQSIWSERNSLKCPDTIFEYVWFPGHINWGGAVFTGVINWQDHSGNDDDYDVNLMPDNHGALTAVNPWGIMLEFDSDETIDHFHTSWWESFHHAVDSGNGKMIDGMSAIAFGVVGLDCAHDCHSELHPVFALAIHIKDDLLDDQWAIFVRNWGNEGYCSSGSEVLDDSITSFAFQLPRAGASDVAVTSAEFLSRGRGASGPSVHLVKGEGATATFGFPEPSKRERINGVLHLKWQIEERLRRNSGAPVGLIPYTFNPATRATVDRPDPEERFGRLLNGLSPRQQAIYERLLPKRKPYFDRSPLRKASLTPSAVGSKAIRNRSDSDRDEYDRRKFDALRKAYDGRFPDEPIK